MTAWYERFFGEDYFEIYDLTLSIQRTEAEVDGIVSLLRLEPGARILDLACGHGRHAIPLAARGYEVTGFDLSDVFLDRARRDASTSGVGVGWVQGDMRNLAFDSEFDSVINVFTAFGYFDDPADDLRVLRGVRTALCPGGQFLLETLNRDGLIPRFQTSGFDRTPDGSIVLHERRWDLERDVIVDDVTLVRPDGTRTGYQTSVRVRSLHGYLDLLQTAGLEPVAWYGGLDGAPFELTSRRLVLVARRPAD